MAGARPETWVLGLETSCDETAAAVVADGRVVRSNVVASQTALHAAYGGVFPEMASRQHVRDVALAVLRALADAGASWDDLSAIAVTRGPGLSGSLLVGLNAAKGIALARGLPLVGVNHLEGHLYSNWLHRDGALRTPALAPAPAPDDDPPFPHLALIVSGGHTELVHVRGHGDYEVLGATRDDAAGEAFDKAARMLGLGYPGGPAVERAAAGGDASAARLPIAATASPYDFSFSGLKSALRREIEGRAARGEPPGVADLAASFQVAVVGALVAGARRALADRPSRALLVAGGVSANGALAAALREAVDVPVRVPPFALCTDNAAMIAAAGTWRLRAGQTDDLAVDADPNLGL